MSDQTHPFTAADSAIVDAGACALCSDERVSIWHTDFRCPQLEDEDERS